MNIVYSEDVGWLVTGLCYIALLSLRPFTVVARGLANSAQHMGVRSIFTFPRRKVFLTCQTTLRMHHIGPHVSYSMKGPVKAAPVSEWNYWTVSRDRTRNYIESFSTHKFIKGFFQFRWLPHLQPCLIIVSRISVPLEIVTQDPLTSWTHGRRRRQVKVLNIINCTARIFIYPFQSALSFFKHYDWGQVLIVTNEVLRDVAQINVILSQ